MRPENEDDLSVAIREARGPLAIRGGGTAGLTGSGAALETGGLSGISLYEPGALTVVAGAGTPLAEVEAALAQEGQRLAFEPMDYRALLGTSGEPTLGGVVAQNRAGPRRVQAGACRDFLLGVRFVDGAGQIVKNGGRVMKNVTGYDLVKLMCGAYGTLGVLSEVAFKVLPVPEVAASLRLEMGDAGRAVKAMAAALGSPFEVSGAAWDGTAVWLRVEGFETSVRYRLERLQTALADFGGGDVAEGDWRAIRDAQGVCGAGDIWRLSVKPSDAPGVLDRLGADAHLLDWGGGLIWARMAPGTDVRARMGAPGHATLIRGTADSRNPRFHPEAPALAAISAGLRARFDPRGILNTGLMGAAAAEAV